MYVGVKNLICRFGFASGAATPVLHFSFSLFAIRYVVNFSILPAVALVLRLFSCCFEGPLIVVNTLSPVIKPFCSTQFGPVYPAGLE